MAYTFDRIGALFNRDRDQNADVTSDGKKGGGYGTLKTSATGDITSGTSGSATGTGGEQATPQGMMAPSAAAIKRNVQRTTVPGFAQRISGELDTASQNLGQEASQYRQKYENQDYGVSPEDIKAAVEGNQEKLGAVTMRYQTPKYGQVESFAPKTDTSSEDAALLGSEGGTARLLSRQAGGRYTPGESAFDIALLRKNPEFNKIVSQIGQKQGQLTREEQRLRSELPQAAQSLADTRYEAGTQALRQGIEAAQTAALTPSQQAAAERNTKLAQLRQTPDQAFIAAQRAAADAAAKADLSKLAPRAERFLGQTGLDPSAFYGIAGDVTPDDLIAAEDAARFNRIQQILGTGLAKSAGAGAGAEQIFNTQGYQQQAIQKALGMRQAEDERLRGRMGELSRTAQERADAYNAQVAKEEQDTQAAIQKIINDYGFLPSSFLQSINPSSFYNKRGQVSTQDVYTPEEAAEINAAIQDLGSMDPRVSAKNYQAPISFNRQALLDLLEGRTREQVQANTSSPTPGPAMRAGEYLKERGEVAKDYLGKRNPFKR